MKIALIADIHGNSWALKNVLHNIKEHGADRIINLGDTFYGPLNIKRTAELLLENKVKDNVLGNQDRIILENLNKETDNLTLRYVIKNLNEESINILSNSKPEIILENGTLFCCHGTPDDDSKYLLEDVSSGMPNYKKSREIEKAVSNTDATIICCAHSHLPGIKILDNGVTVINPGSVGLPAYDDDAPVYHKMETGSPNACYVLIEIKDELADMKVFKVPYNFEAAAEFAEKNGRPDWASWIRTGKVS